MIYNCTIYSRQEVRVTDTSFVRGGLPGSHTCSPKEIRYGTLRRCGPTHGGVKAQRVPAVATLRDGGFLTMDEDHFLHLTDVGREVAEKIYERHCFFTEQLIAAGVDPRIAEADACRIEHIISDESFSRLKEAAVQE